MKTHSLFLKTLAILVVLVAALGVAVVVTSSQRIDQMLTEQYVSKGIAIAESIAGSSVEVLLYRDSSTVQATIDQYLNIQGVAYVFVEDRKGDIISHTFAPSIPDSVRHLKGDRHKSTNRLVAGEGIGECIDVTAPLLAGEVGFVHVGMDRQLIHAAIRAAIVEQVAMMSAILFIGLLAAYFLVKKITQPLNQLTDYARELADDDSMTAKAADDALAPIAASRDEVGQLAQAFRHMVQEVSRRELGLRLAEETLRRSESHFRSLIENVTDIILKVNAEGNAGYVSPSVRQVLGFEPDHFLTHNLLDLVHASDLDRVKETFGQACRQTESIGGVEFRLQHQDGSYRLVDASFNNLLADPSVQSLIVTLRDITEHRRTEELWRIADENQRLVAAIPSILIKLDNEGRVTKWNPAAEETFMVAAAAAVGVPLDALANALEAEQLTASIRDSMAARRHVSLDDSSFTRPDGIRRHLNISITPIFGPDGGPQGALLLGTDTTERRNLETQLANSQKLESIGQLAAGIAHEINTPIQ
ncbi:MAG TPA: PAS domain S-box protein, partial [Gemmataceae bacterium]|nr:PAS domain S-box protein [Gemmataceae bacterium]